MAFLQRLFKNKEDAIHSYADFWAWFQKNEKTFHSVVKEGKDIEKNFFDKLSPKLDELKKGYFYLTGVLNDQTVELVFTADGNTKNIVFVEDLVASAPKIEGWQFTALKPPMDINNISIEMEGIKCNSDNLFFYANDLANYPDEIDISVIHTDMNKDNTQQAIHGVYIFLDHYLGELDFATNIDNLEVISSSAAQKELVPIHKLKDYLIWRQKEFVEKYEGIRYNTEKDNYSMLEAELDNGNMLLAVVNSKLLNWDRKASHPWIGIVIIKYDGRKTHGMPNEADYAALNELEDDLMKVLLDKEGYLNIGRQTADNEREIYFACKDFRKPSIAFYEVQKKYAGTFDIEFDIYKDKYWRSFERFTTN